MHHLAIIGLGGVGRALVSLLARKRSDLTTRGIDFRVTGVASRQLGWVADPAGLDEAGLARGQAPAGTRAEDLRSWLRAAQADVVFECSTLEPHTGQPAIEHLRAALDSGAHAVSANKGPVVHAYEHLSDLARQRGRRFLFESCVMDGVPVFNLVRECLPMVEVLGFRGVLNSTTNVILEQIERGASFEQGVRAAQDLGVAEADPGNDVDGWDGAVKVAALVRVLMKASLRVEDVERQGIRGLTAADLAAAREQECVYKLVCRATRRDGAVVGSVRPERLSRSDPLAGIAGTSSALFLRTDICPEIGIVESDPGLETTAYGLLADFVTAVGARG